MKLSDDVLNELTPLAKTLAGVWTDSQTGFAGTWNMVAEIAEDEVRSRPVRLPMVEEAAEVIYRNELSPDVLGRDASEGLTNNPYEMQSAL